MKMIHIKEQKNEINDINYTKLLDLIKQSSLIFRSCFSWSDHPLRSCLHWSDYLSILF